MAYDSKTLCVPISNKISVDSITIRESNVSPVPSVHNIGVIFDDSFSFYAHIFRLRNIHRINFSLTLQARVFSHVSMLIALLVGLLQGHILRLQSVLNSVTRAIARAHISCDYATTLLAVQSLPLSAINLVIDCNWIHAHLIHLRIGAL